MYSYLAFFTNLDGIIIIIVVDIIIVIINNNNNNKNNNSNNNNYYSALIIPLKTCTVRKQGENVYSVLFCIKI